jgi:hypothetical protein
LNYCYRPRFTYLLSAARRPHSLQLEDVRHVVTYIINLADEQGMALPGRITGFPRDAVKVRIKLF